MKGFGVLLGAVIGLLLHLGGCKKDPVGPPPPKNPREYTWTVDTLAYPGSLQTLMKHIWGSSSSDMYICGWNDRAFGRMYHFNGQGWTNVKLLVSEGGPLNLVGDFGGIIGFSSNSIYAVGVLGSSAPFFIHFNGSKWREITVPNGRGLQSIWPRSQSEIWLGGIDGFLAMYNGSQFSFDTLQYTFDPTRMNIHVSQITGNPANMNLVLGVWPDTLFAPIFYFYEQIGARWEIRDSSYEFARLFIDPAGTVYRYGYDGVQRRQGSSWVSTLSGLTVGRNGMAASSSSNMFVAGNAGPLFAGRVYHYNGSDWFEYPQLRLSDVSFQAVWTDGTETFVVGTTSGFPMKTVVLHGK